MADKRVEIQLEATLDPASGERIKGQLAGAIQQGATAGSVATAEEKAGAAAQARLDTLLKQNQALVAQIDLIRRAQGLPGDQRPALPNVLARGRVLGRQIVAEPLSADERQAFVAQQRLAGAFQRAQSTYSQQAAQAASYGRQVRGGFANLFGSVAAIDRSRQTQIRGGFANLFGAGVTRDRQNVGTAARFGVSYEQFAVSAQKAGLSVDEFARKKRGALTLEERNEQQMKRLSAEQNIFGASTDRSAGSLGRITRVLTNLAVAFVGFRALGAITEGFRALVQYQSLLQQVRLGVAEVVLVGTQFKSKITGAVLPVADQIKQTFLIAGQATRQLVANAADLGLPVETLLKTFQAVGGVALANNIPLKDTLQIVTEATVLSQRLGLSQLSTTRSLTQILSGLVGQRNVLGRILQLNQAVVDTQIQQGTLGQFVLDRLRGVAETLPRNLQTFEGIRESLRSIVLDLSNKIGAGAFQVLQDALSKIRDYFNDIRKPENVAALRHYAFEATQFATALRDAVKATGDLITKHQELLKLVLAIYAGRKLGGAGAIVGAAGYATGAISGTTATALAAPLLFGAARGASQFGLQLAQQGVGAGLADVATAASRAFPLVAEGATAAAIGLFTLPGAIAAAVVALAAITAFVRRTPTAPQGPIPGYAGASRVLSAAGITLGGLNDTGVLPSVRSAEAKYAAQLTARAQRGQNVLAVLERQTSPERLGELERLSKRNPRLAARAEAELLARSGESGPVAAGANAAALVNPAQGTALQKGLEALQGRLVEQIPSGLEAQLLKALAVEVKGNEETFKLREKEVQLAHAQEQQQAEILKAEEKTVSIRLQIIGEAERAIRLKTAQTIAEQNLRFTQTEGARRTGAEATAIGLQARLGLVTEAQRVAESGGRVGAVQALEVQRQDLERQLLGTAREVADVEVNAAKQATDQAKLRVGEEQKIIDTILPQRLAGEQQLIALQAEQAKIRKSGAEKEIDLVNLQLLQIGNTIDLVRGKIANAGTGIDTDKLNEQLNQLQDRQSTAQIDRVKAQTEAGVAGAQIDSARLQGVLAQTKGVNDLADANNEVTDRKRQADEAAQGSVKAEAELNSYTDKRNQLLIEQAKRTNDVNAAQNKLTASVKQMISDLFFNPEDALKNLQTSVLRAYTESFSTALVNSVQDAFRGGGGGLDLGGIFRDTFGGGGGSAAGEQRIYGPQGQFAATVSPSAFGGGGGNIGGVAQILRSAQQGGLLGPGGTTQAGARSGGGGGGGFPGIGSLVSGGKSLYGAYQNYQTGGLTGAVKGFLGFGSGGAAGAAAVGSGAGVAAGTFGTGVGALSATGGFASTGAPILADVYGTSFAGAGAGVGTFSAGVGGAGTGAAGAGAAGGAAGGLAVVGGGVLAGVVELALSIIAADATYKKLKYSPTISQDQLRQQSLFAAEQSGVNPFGFGGKNQQTAEAYTGLFGGGNLLDPRESNTIKAIGALVNPVGAIIGLIGTGIAKGLFQQPTSGTIVAHALVGAFREVGLTRDVLFDVQSRANRISTKGLQGIPANLRITYDPETLKTLRGFAAAEPFGLTRGSRNADLSQGGAVKGLFGAVQAAASGLGLSAEDALGLSRQVGQKFVGSFQGGAFKVLANYRKSPAYQKTGGATQAQAAAQIVSLYDIFNDLPVAIDRAALSLAVFGKDGTASLDRLKRVADDALAVVGKGLGDALTQAIKSGDPLTAAQNLAQTFADTFTARLGERLTQQGAVGAALTKAVELSDEAAQALAAGDKATYATLLQQAQQAYLAGQKIALTKIGAIYGPTTAFLNSIGVFNSGTGLINPTGAGLPTFGSHFTMTATHVAGPPGAPSLHVLHGGEVVRAGAQEDAIVSALQTVADALSASRPSGDGTGPVYVTVKIGDQVIQQAQRSSTRRDGIGRGVRTPATMVGIAG